MAGALTRSAALAGPASAKRGATKRFSAHYGRPGTAASLFPGRRRGESGRDLRNGDGSRQRETASDKGATRIAETKRSTFRELLLLLLLQQH